MLKDWKDKSLFCKFNECKKQKAFQEQINKIKSHKLPNIEWIKKIKKRLHMI